MLHFFRTPLLSFWAVHRSPNTVQQSESLLNMVMNLSNAKTASAKSIAMLKKTVLTCNGIDELKDKACYICLNDFCKEESILTMNCAHLFHESCLLKWLSKGDTCPVCRRGIDYQIGNNN